VLQAVPMIVASMKLHGQAIDNNHPRHAYGENDEDGADPLPK
jgi:hypothetical protein